MSTKNCSSLAYDEVKGSASNVIDFEPDLQLLVSKAQYKEPVSFLRNLTSATMSGVIFIKGEIKVSF